MVGVGTCGNKRRSVFRRRIGRFGSTGCTMNDPTVYFQLEANPTPIATSAAFTAFNASKEHAVFPVRHMRACR